MSPQDQMEGLAQQIVGMVTRDLAAGRTMAQIRAQMLAFDALNAQDTTAYMAVWYTAKAGGLMGEEIVLDSAVGTLGDYLDHKSGLLKKVGLDDNRPAQSPERRPPSSLRDDLGL